MIKFTKNLIRFGAIIQPSVILAITPVPSNKPMTSAVLDNPVVEYGVADSQYLAAEVAEEQAKRTAALKREIEEKAKLQKKIASQQEEINKQKILLQKMESKVVLSGSVSMQVSKDVSKQKSQIEKLESQLAAQTQLNKDIFAQLKKSQSEKTLKQVSSPVQSNNACAINPFQPAVVSTAPRIKTEMRHTGTDANGMPVFWFYPQPTYPLTYVGGNVSQPIDAMGNRLRTSTFSDAHGVIYEWVEPTTNSPMGGFSGQ